MQNNMDDKLEEEYVFWSELCTNDMYKAEGDYLKYALEKADREDIESLKDIIYNFAGLIEKKAFIEGLKLGMHLNQENYIHE